MEQKKLNVRVASDSKEVIEMLKDDSGVFPEIRRRCDEISELLVGAGITSLMIMFDALDEDEFVRKITEKDPDAMLMKNKAPDRKVH